LEFLNHLVPGPKKRIWLRRVVVRSGLGTGVLAGVGKSRVYVEAPLLSRKQSARKMLTAFYRDQLLSAGLQAGRPEGAGIAEGLAFNSAHPQLAEGAPAPASLKSAEGPK